MYPTTNPFLTNLSSPLYETIISFGEQYTTRYYFENGITSHSKFKSKREIENLIKEIHIENIKYEFLRENFKNIKGSMIAILREVMTYTISYEKASKIIEEVMAKNPDRIIFWQPKP